MLSSHILQGYNMAEAGFFRCISYKSFIVVYLKKNLSTIMRTDGRFEFDRFSFI